MTINDAAADAPTRRVVIVSRHSALAMWQARHIQARLAELYPKIEISIRGVVTEGDRRLGTSLAKIGGKGLFVKELEEALARGEADLAVHSVKDVPMNLPEGFTLAAITERADPRDAFVSSRYRSLNDLPAGGRVGTSSLRRESQLRARYPQLVVEPLRGNVPTRIRKLDEGRYDAVILAAAGLKRLGLEDRITALLTPEESLPAVGQGALGLECRAERADLALLLAPLNHRTTALCVSAERALSRALTGSCNIPLGGFAEMSGERLRLRGFVGSPDGRRQVSAEREGPAADPEALGVALAERLKAQGAAAILAALEDNEAADKRR
jgi:hydroxymethylbilane synthase